MLSFGSLGKDVNLAALVQSEARKADLHLRVSIEQTSLPLEVGEANIRKWKAACSIFQIFESAAPRFWLYRAA